MGDIFGVEEIFFLCDGLVDELIDQYEYVWFVFFFQ